MTQASKSTQPGGDDTPLRTRIVVRQLRSLRPRHIKGEVKNARFMKAATFNQFVANLKRDKVLTQLPLVFGDEILSGHHRVLAALKAGIEVSEVQELVGEYTEERLTAIQLAHNAIVGDDDPATLAEMYEGLPLAEQLYSGVTDDYLASFEKLDLSSMSAGRLEYQDVVVSFLPEHAEAFTALLDRVKARAVTLCAPISDFDRYFDTVVRVKNVQNVFNSGLAIREMARLAAERLDQIEAERAADGQS